MTTTAVKTLTVNGVPVEIQGERNLLEVIRKTGIELPTFCYHSDLSVYGACRLCLVEVEKRGIMAACSTPPENGMVVHTDTKQLREIRKSFGRFLSILLILLGVIIVVNSLRVYAASEKNSEKASAQ